MNVKNSTSVSLLQHYLSFFFYQPNAFGTCPKCCFAFSRFIFVPYTMCCWKIFYCQKNNTASSHLCVHFETKKRRKRSNNNLFMSASREIYTPRWWNKRNVHPEVKSRKSNKKSCVVQTSARQSVYSYWCFSCVSGLIQDRKYYKTNTSEHHNIIRKRVIWKVSSLVLLLTLKTWKCSQCLNINFTVLDIH